MKTLKSAFENIFTKKARSRQWNVYKEWNYQRSQALGPSDLAEIDAIFSRHINSV